MKILLTGGTGFIGKELGILLTKQGHQINCLSRNPELEKKINCYPAQYFKWEGDKEIPPEQSLIDIDAIIHLAGENIANKRWTPEYKKKLVNSRVQSTQNIIEGLKKFDIKPKIFIGASAVGFYGDRGDELLDEQSPKGKGFLADLCEQWENASLRFEEFGLRRCILRFGLVISELGGILDETIRLSHRGGLSRLGLSGHQWMSWIQINDLCRLILWCLENEKARGVYNAVSNNPIQNKNFVKAINHTLKNFSLPAVPSFALKIVLGERSILLLSSQKLKPSRALKEGFEIKQHDFSNFLTQTFPNWDSGQYLLKTKIWLADDRNSVFSFFKDVKNLQLITPKNMKLEILSKSTPQIQENSRIVFKTKIFWFFMKFSSKITEFLEPEYFTDKQLKGPYKKWEHTHTFHEHCQGTLIEDKVVLKLRFGMIARVVAFAPVINLIKKMFFYRSEALGSIYQSERKAPTSLSRGCK